MTDRFWIAVVAALALFCVIAAVQVAVAPRRERRPGYITHLGKRRL